MALCVYTCFLKCVWVHVESKGAYSGVPRELSTLVLEAAISWAWAC